MQDQRPLIVTAALDPQSFARLDALRRAHFPPARNHLSAHLTLFHHLPGARLDDVVATAKRLVRRPPLPLRFTRVRSLGRGVAFDVSAADLVTLRAAFADVFGDVLTPQDRNGFRPHVTVQNKVDAAQARALLDELADGFAPWSGHATGLLIWRYLGRPWELAAEVSFTGAAAQ